MNQAIALQRAARLMIAFGFITLYLTGCGYKGPLMMPPEPYVNQQTVEKMPSATSVDKSTPKLVR